ncbi:hypothetical protein QWY85_17770 [Neolewinella lacunae]|uniref:Uncharacterized protein n=1 Tax=Neolewinella lacunae TaxID=1517758 RepID=A0A923TED1_9BACT|nr:hypothetical protein [Neolewinella lacunae]MBC6995787.1 hypothetical protein [Neolewinella lacunae]MDN3636520.1 hypothetical protein [Neolewinella lacunae]
MNDIFDLIALFFAELTNEEKIILALLALLVFTFGVVVGWIVQGSKTRRYKKELLLLRKDRDEYEAHYRSADAKQKALAKELEVVSHEKVAALDRTQALTQELALRSQQLTDAQQAAEELRATNQSYAATIESLNDQVIGLKTQNEQLLAAGAAQVVTVDAGAAAGDGPGDKGGVAASNESLNAYIAQSEYRFRLLEERIAELTAGGNSVTSRGLDAGGYVVQQPGAPYGAPAAEPLIIRADTAQAGVRLGSQGGTEVIVQATPSIQVPILSPQRSDHHDDLTRIRNIGPFLQRKLNEADIYSYEQIANWKEADIVTYTELIGYLPGIIERDDWVGQARQLLNSPDHDAEPHDASPEEEDAAEGELRIVEGIGPKIESVLRQAGITSLTVLAETSAETLRNILDAAGPNYKSHDPKTWPVQAGLATDGKMEELKAWQRELKGGKND